MKGAIIIEPEHSDITDILGYQGIAPMAESRAIDEFLKEHWKEVSFQTVSKLFYIGYIEGKRAE